jgi:hypothetical protein
MKVLELFAGNRCIGKAFEEKGHEVFSIEWNPSFPYINWYTDISQVRSEDILEQFGKPDIIWASPDCTTYSVAAISHHRKQSRTGNLEPTSSYAEFCDATNKNVLKLIQELQPKYFFIENPRGGFRKMDFMQGIPRYTITYCQYGDTRMKPTDIFTNYPYPDFKPVCKNGDPCHDSAPRGSRTGTQGIKGKANRSNIPKEFCGYIVYLCESNPIDNIKQLTLF